MKNKTLVLEASDNPDRYSHLAIKMLAEQGHPILAIGKKAGKVDNINIITTLQPATDIDTVTLYVNPTNQVPYYNYILSLAPRRIIFNPGTENDELEELAQNNGIQPVIACTLVLLRTGQY